MWRWMSLIALSGCSLYFDNGGDDDDGGPGPLPDAFSDPSVIARPCIRAVAAADFMLGGHAEVYLTYVCDAPGAGGIIEYLHFSGDRLVDGMARADFQQPFVRAFPVDMNAQPPQEVLNIQQYTPGGWIFGAYSGFRYDSNRAFIDATIGNLNNMDPYDMVFAGDGAIRMQPQMFYPNSEVELLTGKQYQRVAIGDFGGSSANDLFVVAGDPNGPIEMGVALQTNANPLTFSAPTFEPANSDVALPLTVADVDGDGKADVIGGTRTRVFIRSSKTGMTAWLDDPPHAVTAADIDADGKAEAIFMTKDRLQIRRISISSTGALSGSLILAKGGEQMAMADIDGDQRADVLLLQDIGMPSSTLTVHLAAKF